MSQSLANIIVHLVFSTKGRRSPPCSFNWLITPQNSQDFHHLKLTTKLSSKWGALQVTIQALGWQSGSRYLPLQDDIASVAFWYQTEPHQPFPPLPSRDELEWH